MEEQEIYTAAGNDSIINLLDLDDEVETVVKKKGKKSRKKDKPKGEQPDLLRAWKVGYSAAQANVPEGRNPFLSGSSQYQSWLDGWWFGFYDEPLYQVTSA